MPLTHFTVTEKQRKKARERGDARKERKKGKRKREREDGRGTAFIHPHNSWPGEMKSSGKIVVLYTEILICHTSCCVWGNSDKEMNLCVPGVYPSLFPHLR